MQIFNTESISYFANLQPFPINIGLRNFKTLFEVYDWELNEKALVEFDSDIFRCAVDEKERLFILGIH